MFAAILALAQANTGESSADQEFLKRLVAEAIERTHHTTLPRRGTRFTSGTSEERLAYYWY